MIRAPRQGKQGREGGENPQRDVGSADFCDGNHRPQQLWEAANYWFLGLHSALVRRQPPGCVSGWLFRLLIPGGRGWSVSTFNPFTVSLGYCNFAHRMYENEFVIAAPHVPSSCMLLFCSTLQPSALPSCEHRGRACQHAIMHARRQNHSIAPHTAAHCSLILHCVTDASNRGGDGGASSIIGSVLIAGARGRLGHGALWDPSRCGARTVRHQRTAFPP